MSLAETMASTPAMREVFRAEATVGAMLAVAAALPQAGAATGTIPSRAAEAHRNLEKDWSRHD